MYLFLILQDSFVKNINSAHVELVGTVHRGDADAVEGA